MGFVVQLILFFSLLPLSTTDEDECAGDSPLCGPNAVCSNTNGGFSCACTKGYQKPPGVTNTTNPCQEHMLDLLVDVDFPGNDLLHICSPDELHCQWRCSLHDSCQFFTFIRPDWPWGNRKFYCYLKHTASGTPRITVTNKKGLTSGYSLKNCNKTGERDDLLFVNVNVSWREALQYCRQRGSRLVHILNGAIQTRVTQLLSSLPAKIGPVPTAWVGLERCMINPSAPWEWVETGVVEYERWHDEYPRDCCNYHCGQVVQVAAGDYRWWDACCMEERPFICQDKKKTHDE